MICGYNLQVLMSSGSSVIQRIVIWEFKNTQDAELTTILMSVKLPWTNQLTRPIVYNLKTILKPVFIQL